jgi:hypothetical protein
MKDDELTGMLKNELEPLGSSNFNYRVLNRLTAIKKRKSTISLVDERLIVGGVVLALLMIIVLQIFRGTASKNESGYLLINTDAISVLVLLFILLPFLIVAIHHINQKTKKDLFNQ